MKIIYFASESIFTLDELLGDVKVKENNGGIIGFIREYYQV